MLQMYWRSVVVGLMLLSLVSCSVQRHVHSESRALTGVAADSEGLRATGGVQEPSPRLYSDARIGLRVSEGVGLEYGHRSGEEFEYGGLIELESLGSGGLKSIADDVRAAVAVNLRYYLRDMGPVEPWANVAVGYGYSERVYTRSDSGLYWRAGLGATLPVSDAWAAEASLAIVDDGVAGEADLTAWLGVSIFF